VNVEIVTVGNEIISGVTLDTNARFLADAVTSSGGQITRIVSVGDTVAIIVDALREAMGRAEIVLVTGGLGPTPDDLTTEAAAQAFTRALVIHNGFLNTIKDRLRRRKRKFTPSHKRMALLPEGAEPLENPIGTCGFRIDLDKRIFFFLPGVPREMEKMVEGSIVPLLRERSHQEQHIVRSSVLKVFGPTESMLTALLEGMEGDFQLAYLPSYPEIRLRLTVEGNRQGEVKDRLHRYQQEIQKRLGVFIFGKGNDTMEGVVGALLKEKGVTLATAESCTGGLVAYRITQVPGSSEYFMRGLVVYSNQAKEELLGIPHSILERFGAVSKETAELMATEVRQRSGTSLGLAITGIAGPTGGTPTKPVGRVYIALAAEDTLEVKEYDFFGDRHQVRLMASQVALDRLRRYLLGVTNDEL